ncbi:unnamed protein product [Eretmochelys imbricata]
MLLQGPRLRAWLPLPMILLWLLWSSGQFRCMYQYRNDQNQVKNSRLSLPRTLNIPGQKLIPSTGPSPEDPASQEDNI